MSTPVGGWKTKLGAVLLGTGSAVLGNLDLVLAIFPEAVPWVRMLSIVMLGAGAGTGMIGIAHKLERAARAAEGRPDPPDSGDISREQLMASIRFLRSKGYSIRKPGP